MEAAAGVFCDAFANSWQNRYSSSRPLAATKDIFEMCRRSQPGFFFVYAEAGQVLGYIIAPYSIRSLAVNAAINGSALHMIGGLLKGRYGIRLSDVLKAVRSALGNLFVRRRGIESCDARILSIGVAPSAQGKGTGRALMQKGLEALRQKGVAKVRLEVRKNNLPARHLYETLGFREVGEIADATGIWTVMIMDRDGKRK